MPGLPSSPSLLKRLEREPHRFSFFQAVRILETWAARRQRLNQASEKEGRDTDARDSRSPLGARPVGHDYHPSDEVVRFRSLPSQAFAGSELHSASPRQTSDDNESQAAMELVVTFLGLFGPAGALPQHYTQLVVDRVKHRDGALRSFLDLFNHRLVSLFYRAWSKYRLPVVFEQRQLTGGGEDPITSTLYSLVGLGTTSLRGRLEIPDATFLYFGGHFAHFPRNAIALQSMIADYFHVFTEVRQFEGQWLSLEPADQSRLGNRFPLGANDQLGLNVVVGQRVWSVENKFRLRLGPMNYRRFVQFMPDGKALLSLAQFTRMYAGPELDFDVQLVLRSDEVPASRLARHDETPDCRLGWNSWVQSRPRTQDAADAVFVCEGLPEPKIV